jgi:hypothetical protein
MILPILQNELAVILLVVNVTSQEVIIILPLLTIVASQALVLKSARLHVLIEDVSIVNEWDGAILLAKLVVVTPTLVLVLCGASSKSKIGMSDVEQSRQEKACHRSECHLEIDIKDRSMIIPALK